MSLKKGDVVLAPFPFTDLTQTKLRPAVIVWASATGSNDVTLLLTPASAVLRECCHK